MFVKVNVENGNVHCTKNEVFYEGFFSKCDAENTGFHWPDSVLMQVNKGR